MNGCAHDAFFKSLINTMQSNKVTNAREESLCQDIHISNVAQAIGSPTFYIATISVRKAFSCASTVTITATTERVISSTKFAFAVGTTGVTNEDTCGLPTPTMSHVFLSTSIALDNVFKLAALLDWDAQCSSAVLLRLLSDVFFAVLAWPPLLPNSAENVASLSTLPLLCCWRSFLEYKLLSLFLYRGALDYGQATVVLQFCAQWLLCRSHMRLCHWRKDFTGITFQNCKKNPSTHRIPKRTAIQTRTTILPET